jgi:hypothetical protein
MARRDITGAVDFAYLEGFAGGDQQVVDEVLALFREQAELWTGLLDSESEGWRDAVHTIKGASRGIGAVAPGPIGWATSATPWTSRSPTSPPTPTNRR